MQTGDFTLKEIGLRLGDDVAVNLTGVAEDEGPKRPRQKLSEGLGRGEQEIDYKRGRERCCRCWP